MSWHVCLQRQWFLQLIPPGRRQQYPCLTALVSLQEKLKKNRRARVRTTFLPNNNNEEGYQSEFFPSPLLWFVASDSDIFGCGCGWFSILSWPGPFHATSASQIPCGMILAVKKTPESGHRSCHTTQRDIKSITGSWQMFVFLNRKKIKLFLFGHILSKYLQALIRSI